ncbi:HAD-like protein [Coniochaeta ligniaria NRRL 30616]|uniref:Mitochondrial import inner membrane translocase subunit TIM50 n=1 Tax=Coniochaeta ligniaria NRRL 30616 TaxID=1408157 RepID=A0A1J7JKP5_9PEZI|nr:HAD-like protein [Coniochaeta ligniaria NRRL 30616]
MARELQRASQRAHNTRAHANVREIAAISRDWDSFDSRHAKYIQHRQGTQQQVHYGGFHATPPNHNLPRDNLPRNAPIIPQGFHPPAPPARTTSPKPKFRRRDTIVPPSAASGGVPEPSPAYHLRASFLPRQLPRPQPLLVVIDLNGTLLHRPVARNPRHFVLRPLAREFLSYCLDTFHVMIWSSARPANVAAMCDELLGSPDQLRRVVAVWGRDRFGLSGEDYNSRVQCYKRLSAVWDDPAGRWNPGSWNQGNTVLIDDSKEKARSEPYNAIEIPEFLGEEKEHVLPRVHDYLNTLACQADVSTYIRVHPFKPAEKQ